MNRTFSVWRFIMIVCIVCHSSDSELNELSGSLCQRADARRVVEVESNLISNIDRQLSKACASSIRVSFLRPRLPTVYLRIATDARLHPNGCADRPKLARISGGADSYSSEGCSDQNWESANLPNQNRTAINHDKAKSDLNLSFDLQPSMDDALAYLHNESIAGNKYARYLLKICSNLTFEYNQHSNLSSVVQADDNDISSAVEIFAQASMRGNAQASLLLGQVVKF
jgi:hypothetical protein